MKENIEINGDVAKWLRQGFAKPLSGGPNPSVASNAKKVVVTIPCFNTQNSIEQVVLNVKKCVGEVVVIDDGSNDATAAIANSVGAIVISHIENRGYGEALKSCFTYALASGADIIVTIDGDGQHDAGEIPKLLNLIIEEGVDLVIGSRALDKWHDVPFYRKVGICLINGTWNFGSRVKVTDSQSGFRAYSKKAIESLTLSEPGMSISIEILEEIRKKKLVIREVPIRISYENNNSKIGHKAIRHGLFVGISVIRIRLKYLFKR